MNALLETRDLAKAFGGLRAVDRVNLLVEEGEIHAVIGPNGAGKTTLFNVITGHLRPTSGRVFFRGLDITGWPPHRVARI
ncbi:MAG: ABC transporter ATP-binding protein, partial [Chloroflexota bacterium]